MSVKKTTTKTNNNTTTIAFAGGGSGGHILPIISLLQYIDGQEDCRKHVDAVYRFGEQKSMEHDFFLKYVSSFQHICPQFISILAGKYRRETIWISKWRNVRDLFLFPLGIIQSLWYIWFHKIDVVFCKGGYVALPPVIAAWILRKKILVHDSDTTAGLTTRLAARFSAHNFSGFPDTLPGAICVGQILSGELVSWLKSGRVEELKNGMAESEKNLTTILVAGGSLGAKKLYLGVLEAIKQLGQKSGQYRFVVINGEKLIEQSDLPDKHDHIVITPLIKNQSEMGQYYASADLAIVRGGTTTLAECKLFDLPLVIVPLPTTHDQRKNAEYYVDQYGDRMIDQNDVQFVQSLVNIITSTKIRNKIYDLKKITNTIQCAKQIIIKEFLA